MEEKPALLISLTDAELSLLGRFVVVWNQIEMFLDVGVLILLDIGNDSMERIMGTPHVPSKADIFEALVREKASDAKLLDEAIDCAKRIKDLSNFRNDVIHGRWATATETGLEEARKKFSAKPINVQQVGQRYGEICKLSHRMANLVQALSRTYPSRPRPEVTEPPMPLRNS